MIQSFIVDPSLSDNTHVFITSVEIYFQTKSSVRGVTVSIREMENGVPTSKTIPFSTKHLATEDVNVSSTASTPTVFTFESPVAIQTNKEYGLRIFPDGMDPDYKVWIARTGETDVSYGTLVNQDTNAGMVFTSTNGRSWTPYQTENLKFKVNVASFKSTGAIANFTTDDQEFLELSNSVGKFIPGELVYIQNTLEAGTLNFTAGNQTVTGVNTAFNSLNGLVSGDWIVANVAGSIQVMQVNENGVISDTELKMFYGPTEDGTNVSWFKTTIGTVDQHMTRNIEKLVLSRSSAKVGSVFADGVTIYGSESGAYATVSSVARQQVSFLEPNIRRIDLPGTRINLLSSLSNGSSLETKYTPLNSSSYYYTNPLSIPSRSLVVGGEEAAEFKFTLDNTTTILPSHISPLLDYGASSVLGYQYIINNDATDEETSNGNAVAKYVSKTATLADGMDAEDFIVYMSAYKPAGTDVRVYAKLISESDSRQPYTVGWTEMVLQSEFAFTSSSTDLYDFKEYKYKLPSTISPNDDTASFDGTDFQYTYNGVSYLNFKKFAVKIVLLSEYYSKVPRIDDIRGLALT